MSLGVALTKWTIWVALLGYAVGAAGLLVARRSLRWSSDWLVMAWTVGCVAYLGHVYSAFQFYHGWSHASAFEETARQTRETVGWEVGEGLFVSYFFTVSLVGRCNLVVAGWCRELRAQAARVHQLRCTRFSSSSYSTQQWCSSQERVRWLGLALCGGLASPVVDQPHEEDVVTPHWLIVFDMPTKSAVRHRHWSSVMSHLSSSDLNER